MQDDRHTRIKSVQPLSTGKKISSFMLGFFVVLYKKF
jgi:hypothetical protein